MANKRSDRGGREESAPAQRAADDRTERHLLKARELLRAARTRLSARDDDNRGSYEGALDLAKRWRRR
jgi:hypothetical protein